MLLVLLVIAVLPVLVGWIRFGSAAAHGDVGMHDFAVFYTAGDLVDQGRVSDLYDTTAFRTAYNDVHGTTGPATSVLFGNSPPFAAAMVPISRLSFVAAAITWLVMGVLAGVLAVRFIGYSWAIAIGGLAIVLLTRPGLSAVSAGQSTFFWALLFAAIFALLKRGSTIGAGALAGMLILKPPLLIGLVLWWLVDRSKHRALLALGLSAVSIAAITSIWMGRAWLTYPASLLAFGDEHRYAAGQIVQLSPWSFFDLAFEGSSPLALLPGAALGIAGGVLLLRVIHRQRDDLATAFAGSIFLIMWLSPHVLVHDWVLLALALGVLNHHHQRARNEFARWALVLAAMASAGFLISSAALPKLGYTFQIGVLALAFVGAEFIRLDWKFKTGPRLPG